MQISLKTYNFQLKLHFLTTYSSLTCEAAQVFLNTRVRALNTHTQNLSPQGKSVLKINTSQIYI